jgi:enolase
VFFFIVLLLFDNREFMIVPRAGKAFKENLRVVTEVYHHLGKLLVKKKVKNKYT